MRGDPLRNPRVKPTIEPDLLTVSIPGLNPGIPGLAFSNPEISGLKNGPRIAIPYCALYRYFQFMAAIFDLRLTPDIAPYRHQSRRACSSNVKTWLELVAVGIVLLSLCTSLDLRYSNLLPVYGCHIDLRFDYRNKLYNVEVPLGR